MLLLTLALAAAQTASAPDIQLDARIRAREVRIERSGEASLQVRGAPGSEVRVDKPAANGRRRLRNVDVRLQAEARVADPQQNPQQPETAAPQ